jgi:hypothetical protein
LSVIKYQTLGVFLWGLAQKHGSVRRDLAELKASNLIGNPVEELAKNGYQFNCGDGKTRDLLSLAAGPFSSLLKSCTDPERGCRSLLVWGERVTRKRIGRSGFDVSGNIFPGAAAPAI